MPSFFIGGVIMAEKTLKEIDEQINKEIEQFKNGNSDTVNIYKLNLKSDILIALENETDNDEEYKVDFDKLYNYIFDNITYEEEQRMEGLTAEINNFLERN
jgi:hypothetical protein